MGVTEVLETELPYLRRYARAVTGDSERGDVLVQDMVSGLIDDTSGAGGRVPLFARLDKFVGNLDPTATSAGIVTMASDARRALLLTAMEGFSMDDAATIMNRDLPQVSRLVALAERQLTESLATDVFIIEDEPLVAAHIAQIAREMGHTISGQAVTRDSAVEACLADPPGLLLCDIMLADRSSGIEAAKIITEAHDLPVIFITAYPQQLLTGEQGEPAFLIPKPFRPTMVKAVISQALIQRMAGLT